MDESDTRIVRFSTVASGIALAFVLTLLPLATSDLSGKEAWNELVTGKGWGFVTASLPYVVFGILTKKAVQERWLITCAALLLVSSTVGTLVVRLTDDAQAGIAYVYVLFFQLIVLVAFGFKGRRKT